mgnify:CR=1 FL=1
MSLRTGCLQRTVLPLTVIRPSSVNFSKTTRAGKTSPLSTIEMISQEPSSGPGFAAPSWPQAAHMIVTSAHANIIPASLTEILGNIVRIWLFRCQGGVVRLEFMEPSCAMAWIGVN